MTLCSISSPFWLCKLQNSYVVTHLTLLRIFAVTKIFHISQENPVNLSKFNDSFWIFCKAGGGSVLPKDTTEINGLMKINMRANLWGMLTLDSKHLHFDSVLLCLVDLLKYADCKFLMWMLVCMFIPTLAPTPLWRYLVRQKKWSQTKSNLSVEHQTS